jgi:serine/threonine protein phosphatase PrpC
LDKLSEITLPLDPSSAPADDEIDVYGVTHVGMRRKENQDQFLVCSLHEQMEVHLTSLTGLPSAPRSGDRLAVVAMVADGVGGVGGGPQASRLAVEATTLYLSQCVDAYYASEDRDRDEFATELTGAAFRAHDHLLEAQKADPSLGVFATTLTIFIGVWPKVYLVQVGDSRYYTLAGEELRQVSRDQTVAQELVDSGALEPEQAAGTRWARLLSSSIGGTESHPVVTVIDNDWNMVHLLCSDGLTKHLSDDHIRERLMAMTSARQVCEDLLQDALDAGGRDNITLIVGRAVPKVGAP